MLAVAAKGPFGLTKLSCWRRKTCPSCPKASPSQRGNLEGERCEAGCPSVWKLSERPAEGMGNEEGGGSAGLRKGKAFGRGGAGVTEGEDVDF